MCLVRRPSLRANLGWLTKLKFSSGHIEIMPKALLRYDKGTILIEGLEHMPYANFDPRINRLRAPALYYRDIVEFLNSSEVEFIDEVLDLIPSAKIQVANH